MTESDTSWRTYEEVAVFLLNQIADRLGLECFEGKQILAGNRTGNAWEIDGKGVAAEKQQFVILECRRYTTSRLKQEHIAAIAYRIMDAGASGGIVVSPLGLQEGAKRVADAEKIVEVKLSPDSTTQEYLLRFLREIHAGLVDELDLKQRAECTIQRASGDND